MSWRETLGVEHFTDTPNTHNPQNTQKPSETLNCADIAYSAGRDKKQDSSKPLKAMSMSWRKTLGVAYSTDLPNTHNPHNTQKPNQTGNCADIAYSACRNSKQVKAKLLESLSDACRGLDIAPAEVHQALSVEDIEHWRRGDIDANTLSAFAVLLAQRRKMDQGIRPDHYTKTATCERCGPIWLWFSGEVLGCPWCWNRVADRPIPRPCSVHCGDCLNFEPIEHPHLGHCIKGESENFAGLWDTDKRDCERFLPRPK